MDLLLKYFTDFSPKQINQFTQLEALYKEWNEQINVISRKDIESLYLKHILHSLSIATLFNFKPGQQVIDIGTGGGFPGVPLAIFFPETEFLLVDSIGKKLKVVDAVKETLGLTNLTTQHTRAEQITNRKFDVAVSRAVAPLKELIFWSKPLLKKHNPQLAGGDKLNHPSGLICLKGGDLAQEIHESGKRPFVWPIENIFHNDFFKDKFVLWV